MAIVPNYDANGFIDLDANQVTRLLATPTTGGGIAQKVLPVGGTLVPEQYDSIAMTYITSGNGTGEIGTVIYSLNSSPIATLTLTYDSSNRIIGVSKS